MYKCTKNAYNQLSVVTCLTRSSVASLVTCTLSYLYLHVNIVITLYVQVHTSLTIDPIVAFVACTNIAVHLVSTIASILTGRLYAIVYARYSTVTGVLNITIWDQVCQWLVTSRWFPLGTQVSSTNKTDHQDITEILLKVALSTINQPNQSTIENKYHWWIWYTLRHRIPFRCE
jgi:hypothetical protein